jgi:SMODS and SLOG-associating 2TM effector domain 2
MPDEKTRASTQLGRSHSPERPRKRRGNRDLTARTFPLIDAEQWQHPDSVLRQLYLDTEEQAIDACEWYLRDRLRKKDASRILRGLAIAFATAGGLFPLVSVTVGRGQIGWGYVLLVLAGACVGFDHFLGLSSRWMRDMVTAQKIKHRLQEFQLDWAILYARNMFSQGTKDIDIQEYLELIRKFTADLSSIMIEETSEWVTEFQTGLHQLESQTGRK